MIQFTWHSGKGKIIETEIRLTEAGIGKNDRLKRTVKGTFQSNENILYLDYGCDYIIIVYIH